MSSVRIGMLTPSSNTILEPLSARIFADLEGVTAHFSRIRVTDISLTEQSGRQFSAEPMLAAARLLADAEVDAIVWNGTSGSWLGLDHDYELCESIRRETGVPATTSAIALVDAIRRSGISQLGLVTPYTADVSSAITGVYGSLGISCKVERCCGLHVNKEFAYVSLQNVSEMVREAALTQGVDGIAIVCTNMRAAEIAAEAEKQYGIPVLDSVAVTAWHSLRLAGVSCDPLSGAWGKVFELMHRPIGGQ